VASLVQNMALEAVIDNDMTMAPNNAKVATRYRLAYSMSVTAAVARRRRLPQPDSDAGVACCKAQRNDSEVIVRDGK